MRSMMTDLTIRVTAALEGLERRVAVLETRATDAANNRSTIISNPYFGQEHNFPAYGAASPPASGVETLERLEAQGSGMESRLPRRPSHDENVGGGSSPSNMHMRMLPPARSTDLDFVGDIDDSHFASCGAGRHAALPGEFSTFGDDNTTALIANYARDSYVARGYAPPGSPVLAPRQSSAMPSVDGVHMHARNLPQRVSPAAMHQAHAQHDSGVAVCEALTHRSGESGAFSMTCEDPVNAPGAAAVQSKGDPGDLSQDGGTVSSAAPSPQEQRASVIADTTSPPGSAAEQAAQAGPRHVYRIRRLSTATADMSSSHGKSGAATPEVAVAPSDASTALPPTAALDSISTAGTPRSVPAPDSTSHAPRPHSGSSHGSLLAGQVAEAVGHRSTQPDAPAPAGRAAATQQAGGGCRAPPDMNPQLAALLAAKDDLAVLRLLQEVYAPCWEVLESSVASGLLSTFCKYAPSPAQPRAAQLGSPHIACPCMASTLLHCQALCCAFRWAARGSNLARMLPWLTALLAEPPCAPVAAFTASQRSATLSAVHAAAFSTRKGHCPEYEQLHKDLTDSWRPQLSYASSQPSDMPGSPSGRQQMPAAANSNQQVCISPEFLLYQQLPDYGFLQPLPSGCSETSSSSCSPPAPAPQLP